MRPIVVVVRPPFDCPMNGSVAGSCIVAADICMAESLSMLNVAIFRSHFVDGIVAPNIDAPSSVAAAVAVGFDAAIALARVALATNSVALDVDCTRMMMMIAAMMMMMVVVWPPPKTCRLPTTFDCSKSLIEPSENEHETKDRKKLRQFETIK